MKTISKMVATGVIALVANPAVHAGGFCTPSCYSYCPPTVVSCTPVIVHTKPVDPPPPPAPKADASRQVRVTYFSTQFNAWFEADAMVAPAHAQVGLSVNVLVPKAGHVRGWVVAVYAQPRMTSPYRTEMDEAEKAGPGSGNARLDSGAQSDALVVAPPVQIPNRAIGSTRVWTSKDGEKQVIAELLSVSTDSIRVRTGTGRVVEQLLDNLSEADVMFVRGSMPSNDLFVSNQR